jgi:hypothetical protein
MRTFCYLLTDVLSKVGTDAETTKSQRSDFVNDADRFSIVKRGTRHNDDPGVVSNVVPSL